jgi:hypothetical protein
VQDYLIAVGAAIAACLVMLIAIGGPRHRAAVQAPTVDMVNESVR